MAVRARYNGIVFPDRAERIADFAGYRVFLDHWDELSARLGDSYEKVAMRGQSRILGIFGEQGKGKTLFASQLTAAFSETKEAIGKQNFHFDEENLWHRIAGGSERDTAHVRDATRQGDCLLVENNNKWVDSVSTWVGSRSDRTCVVIADNAERAYFLQGLVDLPTADFIKLKDDDALMTMAAQRLVDLCRTSMAHSLILVLSNDERFLLSLRAAVEKQHEGLMALLPLPGPAARDKEAVVRINTNRLNRISYWFCLDKAGPDEKKAVFSALNGATTFPASFEAVNTAIRSATANRMGRPAKKNLLSLVTLTASDPSLVDTASLGEVEIEELNDCWIRSVRYRSDWAKNVIEDDREKSLLESEWQLRVVLLGHGFVEALLSNEASCQLAVQKCLGSLRAAYGPGTFNTTRDKFKADVRAMIDTWPADRTVDVGDFWSRGQSRSGLYESRLSSLLEEYNRGSEGFLTYRPDVVVVPFRPCSILQSESDAVDAMNGAIQRNAHVFEFAAIQSASQASIKMYLKGKLPNYVSITQEQ